MLMQAVFNEVVVAESDATLELEGHVYFPPESVRWQHVTPTRTRSLCLWKGVARYFTVSADGVQSRNAAWTYAHPSFLAPRIKHHLAFWNGVQVRAVNQATPGLD